MIQKIALTLCGLLILVYSGYTQAPKQLKEVVVKGKADIRAKGDTLEYDAAHYKTKDNAVVEELLRKLPGVRVDRAGNIIAQGETVQKILVDGKEFFGNDPTIATRNLPADMVSKIQVLDKASDQAAFTGVDDGHNTKTINIITKKDRKKGYFGNVSAGGGTSDRYDAGMNVNSFSGNQQLSLLLKSNNVNKSGFSASELLRMAGNNPEIFDQLPSYALSEVLKMKGVQAITSDPEEVAQLTNPTGLNNTLYGGVNYNNDFAHDVALRSSYFFNRFNSQNNYDYQRYYQLPDTAYHYRQQGNEKEVNNNHRVNGSIYLPLNKNSSIKISPGVYTLQSSQTSERTYTSFNNDLTQLLNEGIQYNHTTQHSLQSTADILFQHKFLKERNTLSVTISPTWLKGDEQSQNIAYSHIYNIKAPSADTIHQQLNKQNQGFLLNNNIVYTLPLSTNYTLQLGENFYYNNTRHQQTALNYDQQQQAYTLPDARYDDDLTATVYKSSPAVTLSAKYKRFNYTAEMALQTAWQQGQSATKQYRINNTYHTLLPRIYAKYQFSRARKISLDYRTDALLPTVSQLQPVTDISDPLYIRKGNTGLQPAIRRSLQASYLVTNAGTGSYTNIQLNESTVQHQFTDYHITDSSTGKQLIYPVNTNGYANTNISFQHFFKTDEEGSGITYGVQLTYNAYPSWFNGILRKNRQYSLSPDVNFNYYPNNYLNITAHINTAYNNNPLLQQRYWLFNYDLSAIATLPWNMQAESEWIGYTTSGLSKNYNTTSILWNATLSKSIGKKYTLKAMATDLLRQNKNIRRFMRDGYTEDQRNDLLGQYYMVSLVYQLRNFKKIKSSH